MVLLLKNIYSLLYIVYIVCLNANVGHKIFYKHKCGCMCTDQYIFGAKKF